MAAIDEGAGTPVIRSAHEDEMGGCNRPSRCEVVDDFPFHTQLEHHGLWRQNLPAGLIAGSAVRSAQASDLITRAILIGVNLGPNLSVTGSLATILWLAALRREGQNIGALWFLKLGFLIMPAALVLALAGALLLR